MKRASSKVEEYNIDIIEERTRKRKKGRLPDPDSKLQKLKRERRKKSFEKSYDARCKPLFAFNNKTDEVIAQSEDLIREKFDFSKMEEKAEELILQNERGHRYLPEERSIIILDYLNMFRDGYSALEATKQFKEKHKCKDSVANKWREEALAMLEKYTVKDIEKARSQQVLRLEGLLQKAIDRDDLRTAQQICDTINKVYGLYNAQQSTVIAPQITFKFGEASSTTIIPQPEIIENNDTFIEEVEAYKF